jgi:hypothetical protein
MKETILNPPNGRRIEDATRRRVCRFLHTRFLDPDLSGFSRRRHSVGPAQQTATAVAASSLALRKQGRSLGMATDAIAGETHT